VMGVILIKSCVLLLQATRQLRLMGVKTPIIALTGNALQSDRELFFEAGVNDFQTKVSICKRMECELF